MQKEIIIGVTGSIAAYKSCDIIRGLKAAGYSTTVIMTKDAEEFITPLTFQTISRNRVYRGLFDELSDEYDAEHISLAKRANLFLIAPATANIIGKIASGIADDLLTCTVMATNKPVLIAPAMNDGMYKNVIVQDNIALLESIGYRFVGPAKGKLADGRVGIGRLADVDDIIKETKRILKK